MTITPAMAQRIEIWPTDRLVPYARNARTHSPEQVAQIAASIVEFGFVNPILVDTNAGIIAGHGRLLAARKLGLGEVPVVVLDHLSETQRRAYIIADNKLAQNAGWDDATLAEHGAVLVRQSKHLVYRLPNGNSFTRSKTQYEGKAQHVELGNLRRALGVTGQKPQPKGEERRVEHHHPTEAPVAASLHEPDASAPELPQQEPDSLKQRIEVAIARAEQEQDALLAAAQKAERRVQMLKALVPFSEEANAEDVLRAIMRAAPPQQPQPVPTPEPPQAITERVQVTRQLVLAATQTFQEPFTVNDVMALMVNGHQIDGGERGRVRASIAQAMATLHERGELVKHQEHFGRRQTIWRKAQLNGNGHSNGVGTRA